MTTLIEIVSSLEPGRTPDEDEDLTIYARRPWTPDSEAIMVRPPDGEYPREVEGMAYLLALCIAREAIEFLNIEHASPLARTLRLIQYAIHDA
jgi:hypothetical protein